MNILYFDISSIRIELAVSGGKALGLAVACGSERLS